jgi:hypothetical protein
METRETGTYAVSKQKKNGYNLNNVRRGANRHFRKNREERKEGILERQN